MSLITNEKAEATSSSRSIPFDGDSFKITAQEPASSGMVTPYEAASSKGSIPSLVKVFHRELDDPQDQMDDTDRDAILELLEADRNFRTLLAVSIIDPSAVEDLGSVPTDGGIMRNPVILRRIEHGGNDFQRVLNGAELLLRLLTESTNGQGVFRFEDHPSAVALVGYLYWFSGATGPAVAFASMSEFARQHPTNQGQDLSRSPSIPNSSGASLSRGGSQVADSQSSPNASDNPDVEGEDLNGRGDPSAGDHDGQGNGDRDGRVDQSAEDQSGRRAHGMGIEDGHEDHGVDLLPRLTVMLVRNLSTPSHKDSIEADLSPLDGGSFMDPKE